MVSRICPAVSCFPWKSIFFGGAIALYCLLHPAMAQTEAVGDEAAVARKKFWIEPSISVRYTASTNARLTADASSDQFVELVPGLRMVGRTEHVSGFFDYSLKGIHYAKDDGGKHVLHSLNTNFTIQALDRHAFVDISGVAATEPLSAFGAPVLDAPANANVAQRTSFRVSPYWRGSFASFADYELRYALQSTHSNATDAASFRTEDAHFTVGDLNIKKLLGWRVEAGRQLLHYSVGRDFSSSMLQATLRYMPVSQLALSAIAGAESTDQMTVEQKTTSIAGVGVTWSPFEHTNISVERQKRYFGNAYDIRLQHRMGRAVIGYSDNQNISFGQVAQTASMGSLFDLLNTVYESLEPDPGRRAMLVAKELERLGLSANLQVMQDYIRSTATVLRGQQLSLAIMGQRTTVALSLLQTNNRRLDAMIPVGAGDFSSNSNIRQRGWNFVVAHRLTPNSAVNAGWSDMSSIGTVQGLEARSQLLTLGATTLISRRTSFGLQLRHVIFRGSSGNYHESGLIVSMTHRF